MLICIFILFLRMCCYIPILHESVYEKYSFSCKYYCLMWDVIMECLCNCCSLRTRGNIFFYKKCIWPLALSAVTADTTIIIA